MYTQTYTQKNEIQQIKIQRKKENYQKLRNRIALHLYVRAAAKTPLNYWLVLLISVMCKLLKKGNTGLKY